MNPDHLRTLVLAVLVIAVPGIACHGYYAYEAAANASMLWRIATVLAYPALLIGLTWGVLRWCAHLKNRAK